MIRCVNIYCSTTEEITRHHLIPKAFRKLFIGKTPRVILCEDCHKRVHKLKTNTELFLFYNTKQDIIDLLANDVGFRISRMIAVTSNNNYAMVA